MYGADGMEGRAGAAAGRGNATGAWEEFKPYTRSNKNTKARDASRWVRQVPRSGSVIRNSYLSLGGKVSEI